MQAKFKTLDYDFILSITWIIKYLKTMNINF